jgi:hypothetical protein
MFGCFHVIHSLSVGSVSLSLLLISAHTRCHTVLTKSNPLQYSGTGLESGWKGEEGREEGQTKAPVCMCLSTYTRMLTSIWVNFNVPRVILSTWWFLCKCRFDWSICMQGRERTEAAEAEELKKPLSDWRY